MKKLFNIIKLNPFKKNVTLKTKLLKELRERFKIEKRGNEVANPHTKYNPVRGQYIFY